MTVETNNTVGLAVIGTVAGQQHVHTLHFRYKQVIGSQPMDDLVAEYSAGALGDYRALFMPVDSPAQLIRATHICGALPLDAPVETAPPAVTGTRVLAPNLPSPSLLAAVVGERTALAGRTRQGRFFLGGIQEQDHTGNNFETGAIGGDQSHYQRVTTYLNTLLTVFGPAGTSADWQLVVHSRKLASVPGTQCEDSSTPVTGWKRSTVVTTMRSRRPGSGI